MKIGVLRSGELVAIVDERVVPLGRLDSAEPAFRTLADFLSGGEGALVAARAALGAADLDETVPTSASSFAAPYVPGAKILCHVVNYPGHATAVGPPERPYFFQRPATSVLADGEPIEAHAGMSPELDWETELAFVIGRTARDVAAEEAYDHIAGFTILNDIGLREYQFNKGAPNLRARFGLNWFQGKGLDASCPIGPWIALRDELPEPYPLQIRTYVNGALRQDATTSAMFHKVPAMLAEASRGVTFHAGDIIATGSPPGAAMDDESTPYLVPGDIVRSEIERIGALENRVEA